MVSTNGVLAGSYDHRLVVLSVIIAVLASYAALDLAGRVTVARGILRRVWLAGGAMAMGIGIWSMHYVGMLAFHLPVPIEYDWPTVLLSLLSAISASAIALFVVSRKTMGMVRALVGSIFMGSGIAGMHYIGMAAMRLPAMCRYSFVLVVLSVVLAVVVSLVALWLTFRFREETRSVGGLKVLSALAMGSAIPLMHYTGMAAASFTPADLKNADLSHALSITSLGGAGIAIITFMVLGLTLVTSLVDRRFSAQTQQLESSEQRSRQILETSFDAFVGMDSRGHIVDWNAQAETTLGWSRSEIMGKSFAEVIIPDHDRARFEDERSRLKVSDDSASSRRFEISASRWDGVELPVEITISAVAHDTSSYFAAFVRDLREYKEAERKLQISLKQLKDMSFALDQHCIVARTDPRGMITYANDRFCSISKYRREELLGRDHRIINSQYHSKEFIKGLWQTIKSGNTWKGEFKNRAQDGSEYWVEATIVPFCDSNGLPQEYIAIRTDVTALKRIEGELRIAKEAAEAANRAKSEFLANMSHEIRTPMNGIIGITDILTQSALDPEQRGYLEMVSSSAQSLLAVLNDILDFSKIESGKLDFNLSPTVLRSALINTLGAFAVQATKKQIELTLSVSDDVPESFVIDDLRLRQVLSNLLGNALKFTEHGEIAVTVAIEERFEKSMGLHFCVRDSGIGIPVEKQKLIFQPFSQADGTITRKYGGTGLGLTISARLVQMMGGRIWVESEPGRGSQFHFTANFEVASAGIGAAKSLAPSELLGKRALIVDDNATNRLILEKLLQRWGMVVASAASADVGLNRLREAEHEKKSIALLVVDSQMPEMDGFTMVQQLREDPSTGSPVIVMLTSAGALGEAERSRQLGIKAFLPKPIGAETLHEAILRAMGSQAQVQRVSAPEPKSAPAIGAHYAVLLAEDNPVNQVVALRHLQKLGHAVRVASNGVEAVALSEAESFDLILMDVQMPGMDGYDATSLIRKRDLKLNCHTPIIAMTAHAMVGDKEKCLAAGMDGYVSKPIDIESLSAAIADVMAGLARPIA